MIVFRVTIAVRKRRRRSRGFLREREFTHDETSQSAFVKRVPILRPGKSMATSMKAKVSRVSDAVTMQLLCRQIYWPPSLG